MSTRAETIMTSVAMTISLLLTISAASGQSSAATQSVEERFQRIEDREAIEELLISYGRFLDKQDLVGYSNLFAADGIWEGGIGSAKGPAAILEMLQAVFSRTTRGQYGNSYHLMSDIIIDVYDDTATSWSRWTWVVEGEDGKPMPQRSGHYEDSLVRENGEWRFQRRLTVTELPTPEKDTESAIWRRDHRDQD